ncbi:MAG: molybdopterin dinucleotide binding domain-containing protein, partial [Pseudomonadota bacterium]
ARENLFVAVHEQFMTETAAMADIVLPATQFMEHDDLYQGGGHQHVMFGGKLIDPPGECRSNHEVIAGLAERLGAEHEGFSMTPRELVDRTLRDAGHGTLEALEAQSWLDVQPGFREAHFLDGFGWPDGKFRFKPNWFEALVPKDVPMGPWREMPELPDHWDVLDATDAAHPFRLATSPARHFLNSSFTETSSSKREGGPSLMIGPEDAAALGLDDGDPLVVGNPRGEVPLTTRIFDGLKRGVVIAEGIWPNKAHAGGAGINTLTGADPVAPFGGAAFHDVKVWIRPG